MGVQWYSVPASQPHLLAGIQVHQRRTNKFKGGHVFTGNSPFPQPEGRRPSWAKNPVGVYSPLIPSVWNTSSGKNSKNLKLKTLFPTLQENLDGRSMHCSGSSKLYWIQSQGCHQNAQKLSRQWRPPSSRWCFLARLAGDGRWVSFLDPLWKVFFSRENVFLLLLGIFPCRGPFHKLVSPRAVTRFPTSWKPDLTRSASRCSVSSDPMRSVERISRWPLPMMISGMCPTFSGLGSMTVMILHPKNWQNWRMYIPKLNPFRLRTTPGGPITPFKDTLIYTLLFQDGLLVQACPSFSRTASQISPSSCCSSRRAIPFVDLALEVCTCWSCPGFTLGNVASKFCWCSRLTFLTMNSPSLGFQPLLQVPPPSLDCLVLKLLKRKSLKLLNRHQDPPLLVHQQAGDFGKDVIRFFQHETSVGPLFRVHALDLGDESQGVIFSDHWTSRPQPAFDLSQSWVFYHTSRAGPCDSASQVHKSSERNYRVYRCLR